MDAGCACLAVFVLGASGSTAPLRRLIGPATGMNAPRDVIVDGVNDEVMVINSAGQRITVYARTADGNTPPLRTVAGASTGLDSPSGLAFGGTTGHALRGRAAGEPIRASGDARHGPREHHQRWAGDRA